MRSSLILALALPVVLAACGGAGTPTGDGADAGTNTLIPERSSGLMAQRRAAQAQIDPTTPMDQVTDLRVEQVPGGIIIRATGLDIYATSYGARLRPNMLDESPEDGTLVYLFRRIVPAGAQPGGAVVTREITVARFVSDQSLSGVRSIRVEAAGNTRTVRR